jgi:hypothetical protein
MAHMGEMVCYTVLVGVNVEMPYGTVRAARTVTGNLVQYFNTLSRSRSHGD